MSKAKPTPGPWVWEYRKGNHPLNDQDGWGTDGLWAVNGGFILGSGQGWDGGFNGPEPADAALIVASPDLLAVAEGYAAWEADLVLNNAWDGDGGMPTLTQAQYDELIRLQSLRNAAIAKAKSY